MLLVAACSSDDVEPGAFADVDVDVGAIDLSDVDIEEVSLAELSAQEVTAILGLGPTNVERVAGLAEFTSCDELRDHFVLHASALAKSRTFGWGGAGGVGGVPEIDVMEETAVDSDDAGAASSDLVAQSRPTGEADGDDFSTTNVAEAGVDEPDIVKTDGERLFSLNDRRLRVIDARSGVRARLLSTVELSYRDESYPVDMLLHEDRLLVLFGGHRPWTLDPALLARAQQIVADLDPGSTTDGSATDGSGGATSGGSSASTGSSDGAATFSSENMPGEDVSDEERAMLAEAGKFAGDYWAPVSIVAEYDVSTNRPRLINELHLEGDYVTARMVDGVVRLVTTSHPAPLDALPIPYIDEATTQNALVEVFESTDIGDWLPTFELRDAAGAELRSGTLATCERVYEPGRFAGIASVNVVTIDLAGDGLGGELDGTSVLSSGSVVYASADNLYVTTTEWNDFGFIVDSNGNPVDLDANADEVFDTYPVNTHIHKFDISDPRAAHYVASGQVEGTVLNQYSLSEYEGNLRIATTTENWARGRVNSESFVTVLGEQDGELVQLGQVGDLGRGERIFAVRYLGDVAAVVTFRQTDPLYTIDLADPTDPQVLGELKILGYSAYLHPVGDDLLLGVGQDATAEGRTLGTQVSLFDISDLTDPIRLDTWTIPDSTSAVEWDARAFLYWAPEGLAVIPVNSYGDDGPPSSAYGLRVSPTAISEVGEVSHVIDPVRRCQEFRTWVEGERDQAESRIECWTEYDYRAQIERAVIVGDVLYTLSDYGIAGSNLADMSGTSVLRWPS